LNHVFEPANHRSQRRQFGTTPGEVHVWDIQYEGHNIWGATAGMLLNLYRLCVTDDAGTIRDLAGCVMSEAERATAALLELMARLRDPLKGCPWDREQTFATIAPFTIEEAYEVADAIDRGDPGQLRDELGDLLFQIVFHARMAQERGWFDSQAWPLRFTISSCAGILTCSPVPRSRDWRHRRATGRS